MKKLFDISVHDLLTWTHYAWMPLFFFDALFLVLTSSSSSCRYMLHLRFSQEGCFVAYQHTPQFTKRVACAYNRIQNNTGRCTIWPSILHHFFHTHNRDFVHELHVWTVRWMSISLPFHTAVPFIRLCYVLDNSASR